MVILGAITLVFAVGAGFCCAVRATLLPQRCWRCSGRPESAESLGGGLLAALKDELFSLETDRLQGRLTDSEYEQHKQALELVLRRALAKSLPENSPVSELLGGDRVLRYQPDSRTRFAYCVVSPVRIRPMACGTLLLKPHEARKGSACHSAPR